MDWQTVGAAVGVAAPVIFWLMRVEGRLVRVETLLTLSVQRGSAKHLDGGQP